MTLKDINKTHALLCVANCLSSVPHIYCRKCIIDFWKSSKNLLCPLCGLFVYSKSDVDNFFKYAQNNNPELMRIIDNGININFVDANRRTALMIASKSNCFDNVKMLIELKANLNLRDKYGKTALWYAISHRNLQIIRALIEAGADVNILDNEGDSCLFYAVENYHEILELLLDRLSDINIKNGKGETLLIKAINENSLTSAKLLIERNIDINTQDNLGHTALMHAIVGLKKIFIDLLIANKQDFHKFTEDLI